ncbi:MAG: SDR family oxidoreductase [Pseudomonadota bacterium]
MSTPQATDCRLDGKVAIVTGASRGIGEAIALSFAAHGARVVLASRKLEPLQAVVAQIEAAGGQAVAHACHVGKLDEIPELVKRAITAYGQVDVLVNNAGTNLHFGPMMGLEWPVWDKIFEVNLRGAFALTRELAQHLMARKAPGSVINISSIAGLRGSPLQGIYAMTKAAMISMTQTLAIELGGEGIRVNAIAPGLVDTRLASTLVHSPEIRKIVLDRTPLGRIGQPDDISGAALFLASDAARYLTGQVLAVDGGWSAS